MVREATSIQNDFIGSKMKIKALNSFSVNKR